MGEFAAAHGGSKDMGNYAKTAGPRVVGASLIASIIHQRHLAIAVL